MKKVVCFVAACVLVLVAVFAAACGGYRPQGQFYTLQEAYEQGYLTYDELMSIAYYHHAGNLNNEEVMPEDYVPQPKTPDVLDQKTEQQIKKDAAHKYNNDPDYESHYKAESFIIERYYGTYGDCVAVLIKGPFLYAQAFWSEKVAGITFKYGEENPMMIWRKA